MRELWWNGVRLSNCVLPQCLRKYQNIGIISRAGLDDPNGYLWVSTGPQGTVARIYKESKRAKAVSFQQMPAVYK